MSISTPEEIIQTKSCTAFKYSRLSRTTKHLLILLEVDLQHALSGGADRSIFVEAAVFPPTADSRDKQYSIVNVTGSGILGTIELPYCYENGTNWCLGDDGFNYPPGLYPNFTYSGETSNVTRVFFDGKPLFQDSTLVLGPLFLDANTSLISMTVAINSMHTPFPAVAEPLLICSTHFQITQVEGTFCRL